jgi:multiple sugar transport system substrate-binding protein
MRPIKQLKQCITTCITKVRGIKINQIPLRESDMDRFLMILGLAVLVLALVFALVVKPLSTGQPIFEENPLVFTQWWEDEMEAGALNALIGEFTRAHPGLRIRLDTRPYNEIRDMLLRGQAKGEPDIIALDPRWLRELVRAEYLENLEAYQAAVPIEFDAYAGLPEQPASEKEAHALPLASFMTALFYRTDILQEAGFDRPPKNQGEFTAYARTVSRTNPERYGFALSLAAEDPFGIYRDIYAWIWASGAALTQNGELRFDTPAVTGALDFLDTLNRERLIPTDSFTKTGGERLADFIAGRTAMIIADIRYARDLEAAGVPFGLTTIPGPASYLGKPVLGLSSWYAGIPKNSTRKAEAWEFLAFLAERKPVIAARSGAIPADTTADPFYAKAYDIYQAGEITEEFSAFRGADGLDTIVGEEIQRMFRGDQSPAATAAAVQARWEAGSGL